MFSSTTKAPKVVKSLFLLSIQNSRQRSSIFESFGAQIKLSFSSSRKDEEIQQKKQYCFRPRRQIPKHIQDVPKQKIRSKKAKAPINLTKGSPNKSLESTYGHRAATAIRHIRQAKEERGTIHNEALSPSAEDMMRAADYLTSATGSTEDLVGERRGLMMEAWDLEHASKFQTELDKIIQEQSEFSFMDIPWKEEENDDVDSTVVEKSDLLDEEQDPNQKAFGPWSETIVRVDSVQKVQRGGTMVRYRALVVGGNLNGCAGFGVAKANAPNEAAAAAARIAKRNIFFVDRYLGTGLTTDLAGRHNSCKVTLRSVNPNRGLHGHPLILEILKYFGISDCSAKSHGNRNVYNVVYATFKALMTHESLEDVALKRGKRLINLERARRLNV